MDDDLRELIKDMPAPYAARFATLTKLSDAFCDAHPNAEYKNLCRDMAATVCPEGRPVLTGKPEGRPAGIGSALGRVNFLHDPSQTPPMKSTEIAEADEPQSAFRESRTEEDINYRLRAITHSLAAPSSESTWSWSTRSL